MDWLDKINITAIALLSLVTVGLMTQHQLTTSSKPATSKVDVIKEKARSYDLQFEKEAKIYKDVITLKNEEKYPEALAKLEEIKTSRPGLSRTYVHLADINYKTKNLPQAILFYRTAVEMEAEYVDKKSPLKIGMQIKEVVNEGKIVFEKAISSKAADKETRQALKNVYYLQRRLAGGCE